MKSLRARALRCARDVSNAMAFYCRFIRRNYKSTRYTRALVFLLFRLSLFIFVWIARTPRCRRTVLRRQRGTRCAIFVARILDKEYIFPHIFFPCSVYIYVRALCCAKFFTISAHDNIIINKLTKSYSS